MGSSKKHKEKEKDRDPEDRHREHKKHRHKDKDREREKRKRSRSRERSSRGAEKDRSGKAEPRVKKEKLDPAFEGNSGQSSCPQTSIVTRPFVDLIFCTTVIKVYSKIT